MCVYAGRYSLNRRGLRDSRIHPIGYDPHPPTSSPPTPSRDVMPQCDCSDPQYLQQLHSRLPPAPSPLSLTRLISTWPAHGSKYEVARVVKQFH